MFLFIYTDYTFSAFAYYRSPTSTSRKIALYLREKRNRLEVTWLFPRE